MSKPKRMLIAEESRCPAGTDLVLEAERLFNRLEVGTWSPNIDVCETKTSIRARVELPGVQAEDVSVTVQNGNLRVQGVKREPAARKLLCYYCLERSYGRFDRAVSLDRVVDTRKARAILENGILTVELPKRTDRRSSVVKIPVVTK